MLGNLDSEGFSYTLGEIAYGDLISHCRVEEDSGEMSYDFIISYCDDLTPYRHMDECVE